MHAQGQQLVGNLPEVVYFRYGHHSIATQMTVDDNGLRVGVADDAQSLVAGEVFQLVLEL